MRISDWSSDVCSSDLKNINLRGTLEWKPSADFTLNLKANYVGHNNNGEIRHTQVFCGPNGVADNLFVLGGAVVIPAGYDCNSFDNVFWLPDSAVPLGRKAPPGMDNNRSEEHTSELQSLMRISYAVFCLKKKKTKKI